MFSLTHREKRCMNYGGKKRKERSIKEKHIQCPLWTGNWNLILFKQDVLKFSCSYAPSTGIFDWIWLFSVPSIQRATTLRRLCIKYGLKITTYCPFFFVLYWEWQKEGLPSPTPAMFSRSVTVYLVWFPRLRNETGGAAKSHILSYRMHTRWRGPTVVCLNIQQ